MSSSQRKITKSHISSAHITGRITTESSGGNVVYIERYVTTQNRISNATDTGTTRTNILGRWHHTIGSGDVNGFKCRWNNRRGDATTNTELATGNIITITQNLIEFNGFQAFVKHSASDTVVLADGSYNNDSDTVLPSQFGLTKFTVGDTFYGKFLGFLPTGAGKIPYGPRNTTDFTGCQFAFYNPGETTVSDITTPGLFTATGIGLFNRSVGFCPQIIGTFVAGDAIVRGIVGDSITAGTGDQGTGNKAGRGHFARSLTDADGVSNPIAGINWAVHGSGATLAIGGAMIKSQFPNINIGASAPGTNNFGMLGTSVSVATMNGYQQQIMSDMRAAGVRKIGLMKLGPRADSTDAWVTETNQTPFAGWMSGGNPDVYNGSINTLGADFILDMGFVRGTDPFKWVVNGVANYSAFDNTHPSTGGHVMMANGNRPIWQAQT